MNRPLPEAWRFYLLKETRHPLNLVIHVGTMMSRVITFAGDYGDIVNSDSKYCITAIQSLSNPCFEEKRITNDVNIRGIYRALIAYHEDMASELSDLEQVKVMIGKLYNLRG